MVCLICLLSFSQEPVPFSYVQQSKDKWYLYAKVVLWFGSKQAYCGKRETVYPL